MTSSFSISWTQRLRVYLFAGGDAIQLWTYPDCKALRQILDLGKRADKLFRSSPGLVAVGEWVQRLVASGFGQGQSGMKPRQIEIPAAQPGTLPKFQNRWRSLQTGVS